jgi:UDP-N-acetylglucosamine--dolichyl-phosphate N-acetylglucosaminephosphotransferase
MVGRQRSLVTLSLLGFLPNLYAFAQLADWQTRFSIAASAIVSAFGFWATFRLIPTVQRLTLRRGLFGMDINKKGTEAGEKKIPEALGLAPGVVFLVCIVLFQQLHHFDLPAAVQHALGGGQPPPPVTAAAADAWMVDYNAALATICFMLFLGFADDVLDIPWRVKLLLPALASLPLLIAYSGATAISLPKPVQALAEWVPPYLELGPLYKLYMVALTVFATNAINILAGVNGLEVGQTFIIAAAVLLHNLVELAGHAGKEAITRDGHLFSAYLMLPLATTSLALLHFNWYPSQVFVGDTFTYFAGMTIAVAGILGHFSETLLLFLLPQIFNFVYSVPQLFKFVPCPRHRLPTFDPATGELTATPNWNLVNLTLSLGGSCTEEQLCRRILWLQAASCAAGFALRHALVGIWK